MAPKATPVSPSTYSTLSPLWVPTFDAACDEYPYLSNPSSRCFHLSDSLAKSPVCLILCISLYTYQDRNPAQEVKIGPNNECGADDRRRNSVMKTKPEAILSQGTHVRCGTDTFLQATQGSQTKTARTKIWKGGL